MGKYSSGVSWVDIEAWIRSIDATHSGKTGVLISARGIGGTGGLRIDLITSFDALPLSNQQEGIITSSDWPCGVCESLEGHLLVGLIKHDDAVCASYTQTELPI